MLGDVVVIHQLGERSGTYLVGGVDDVSVMWGSLLVVDMMRAGRDLEFLKCFDYKSKHFENSLKSLLPQKASCFTFLLWHRRRRRRC